MARNDRVPLTFRGRDARLVVAQDVSERRHTEEALRQAERNCRGIFENAVEDIFQTSPESWSLSANPALARRVFPFDPARRPWQDVDYDSREALLRAA